MTTGWSWIAARESQLEIPTSHTVYYREAHTLIEELMNATLDARRKKHMAELEGVELLHELTKVDWTEALRGLH